MSHSPFFKRVIRGLRESTWGEVPLAPSRREFLKTAALASVAVSTPLGSVWARGLVQNPETGKVAILGAGAAGLSAAYMLTKAGVPCEVFEASARVGGRIWTIYDFNRDKMFVELGGEFVDSEHADLLALVKELGLKTESLTINDRGMDPFCFYFEGKHYGEADILAGFQPLAAHLRRDTAGIYAPGTEIITYRNATPVAKKWDQVSLADYLDSKKDVLPWVRNMIRVAYVTENGGDANVQSSLNLLTYISADTSKGFKLFGPSDEGWKIAGGSTRLIEALQKKLRGKVDIHLNHELTKIEEKSGKVHLTFRNLDKTVSRAVSNTICTIPFSILRKIEGLDRLPLTAVKRQAIQNNGYGTSTKLSVGFSDRVWRKPRAGHPGYTGTVVTDLPSQYFSEMSRAQPGKSGIITSFMGGSPVLHEAIEGSPTVMEDIDKVFPGTRATADGTRTFFNWSQYQWSRGSYTCPLIGQNTGFFGAQGEPELGGRLQFAGEHTSQEFWGYMNGAVETGHKAAAAVIARVKRRAMARSPFFSDVRDRDTARQPEPQT